MSLYVNDVWIQTLEQIIENGREVSPRGIKTKEFTKTTVTLMNYPVLTIKKRKLGYKFLAAEAYWILTGDNKVHTIAPYSKAISEYSDDGMTFFGAYGPKFVDQIGYVIRTLENDPNSRQAVINIWREKPMPTKDVPCTLNVQFTMRDGKLECHANMRSSDLWLGWPYDVFNFSMMAQYVACGLGKGKFNIDLGVLYLHSGCMHLYEKDFKKAKACIKDPTRFIEPMIYSTSQRALITELDGRRKDGGLADIKR